MNAVTTHRPVSTPGLSLAIAPNDVPDPVARVREVGHSQEWTEWAISQNLSDRWGDLNRADEEIKPFALLDADPALVARLLEQMWDEISFVTRKDGKFGILFEIEYVSRESETREANLTTELEEPWFKALRPHATVVKALLDGMAELALLYPGVQFAVPEEKWIYEERPAAWAFFPDGLLSEIQREKLGNALLKL